jgi:hypothetical protein
MMLPGIVDQDAHRAELIGRARQRRVDLPAVTDIGHDAKRPEAFGRRRAGVGVALPDGHPRAERREPLGDAAADALPAAGDDCDPPCQQDVRRIDGHLRS